MIHMIKERLRGTFLQKTVRDIRQQHKLLRWKRVGRFGPAPPLHKQRTIRAYARYSSVSTFVETGTYLGEMIDAVKDLFQEVYSIELSEELFQSAQTQFAKYPHVHLLQGDSSTELATVLLNVSCPCLFWLDGHFSGGITAQGDIDYPVLAELELIRKHPIKSHIILVDDARLFDGEHNVPTLDEILESLRRINPNYKIEVKDDIIRAIVV